MWCLVEKFNLMLLYLSTKFDGWHPALSIKRRTDLPLTFVLRLRLSCKNFTIHPCLWLIRVVNRKASFFTPLKQRGCFDLHITMGTDSDSPVLLTKNAMVNLCLLFLPLLHSAFFWPNPSSGRAFQKFFYIQNVFLFVALNYLWQSVLPQFICLKARPH